MREVSAGHCDILVHQVDMLVDDQVKGMVEVAVFKWGRIDYAVNAAGRSLVFDLSTISLTALLSIS